LLAQVQGVHVTQHASSTSPARRCASASTCHEEVGAYVAAAHRIARVVDRWRALLMSRKQCGTRRRSSACRNRYPLGLVPSCDGQGNGPLPPTLARTLGGLPYGPMPRPPSVDMGHQRWRRHTEMPCGRPCERRGLREMARKWPGGSSPQDGCRNRQVSAVLGEPERLEEVPLSEAVLACVVRHPPCH